MSRVFNTSTLSRPLTRFFKNLWSSKKPGWFTVRILLLLLIAFVTFIMLFEDRFIYFPSKYPEGTWEVEKLGPAGDEGMPRIEDAWFQARDGVRLHGWYCTPQVSETGNSSKIPTLLWFHGNAGNITHRFEMIRKLVQLPARVFIIDYRGYGRSEGSPSEQGLYLDARAAWDYLVNVRETPSGSILIFGDSLGGAVAIDLATTVRAAGLIVQSAFTSISDMAAEVMPFVPTFLVRTKMDSIKKIPHVHAPKLFIHSPADEMVPYRLGRRLYDAAADPKQFYEVAGASHNEMDIVGGHAYFEAISRFMRECVK